jgi:cobalt-zinc-cadmium efflux system protein
MNAEHSHSHHDHFSAHTGSAQLTARMTISLILTLALVVGEVVAGLAGNSLALLSDAAHNITDVIALGLSWYALRLASRPAHAGKTYGYHRAGIMVALINSTTLILIALGIFYEAYHRFLEPPQVESTLLIVVGALAFAINLGTALLLKPGSEHDLNLHSAFLHLMGDVLSTVGAVIAGVLIALTGMVWLDPLVSVLIGGLILYNAWGILRETVNILMEDTPLDLDLGSVVRDMLAVPGVQGVHDLHVWSISRNLRMLSAHVITATTTLSVGRPVQAAVESMLRRQHGIVHATLQLECEGCQPDTLYCDINGLNNHDHAETHQT